MEFETQAWIRQPLALLCRQGGISKPAAIVLALIIDQATNTKPPSPVPAKLDELAERSGYSISSVKRAVSELIAGELIQSQRTGRGSVYTLTGAVELLPPKGKPAPRATATATAKPSPRATAKQALYESCVNRFAAAPPEVCEHAAPPGDPDYEL